MICTIRVCLLVLVINVIIILMSVAYLECCTSTDSAARLGLSKAGAVTESRSYLREQPRLLPRQVQYGIPLKGGQRSPIVMVGGVLTAAMHEKLLDHPMFSCGEAALNSTDGLENRVNFPVYEGYYHSLPTNKPIYSKNPNPMIGTDFMKPPAGLLLQSFFDVFRLINIDFFDGLRDDLLNSAQAREPTSYESDICYTVARWIDMGYVFADLSIQIHYGIGNEDKFKRAWHVDAENSLLHLAVTIRGSRVLHSRRSNTQGGVAEEICESQVAGQIYLSSSALMLHAPRFSLASYEDRVIAIHARILYTSAELHSFRKNRTEVSWESLVTIVAKHLASINLQIPTANQVEKRLNELRTMHD